MDITPELIAEIDFPDSLKGFDKDAVDDFLGQVGTELGRVQYELRKAQRRTSELEQELATASAQAPAAPAESDAVRATRTIMAAEETADRIESDASAEAEKALSKANAEAASAIEVATSESKRLLAEAHAQADRLEADTRREADELLVAARRRAEDEYDARVADYVRLLGEQEARSEALTDDIDSLEGRVGEYRSVLERLVEEVRRVLDDPDELRFRPTLELTAPAVPTGSPAPVPGSVMPEAAASDADATWEPGSWSDGLSQDGGPDVEGDAEVEGASELEGAVEPEGRDDRTQAHTAIVQPQVDEDEDVAAPVEPAPADEAPAPAPDSASADIASVDDATRDDLSFSELLAAADAAPVGEALGGSDAPSVFDAAHDQAGDLTGEYRDVSGSDLPLDGEGGLPGQLQAFDGEAELTGAQPQVPQQGNETTGAVPLASTGQVFEAPDDAFTESGSPRAAEPAAMPAGVEFVDLGDDQPGNPGFAAAPGAFASDERSLSELHDAVNHPDEDQAFAEFGNADEDDDQKGIRRFFGK